MSDILIPKVDLPKNQDFIVITVLSDGFAKIETVKDNCIEMYTSKAIELPSHGRLGDLDELFKRVKVNPFILNQFERNRTLRIISDAPTIMEASTSKREET